MPKRNRTKRVKNPKRSSKNNPWLKHVKSVYKRLKKENPNITYKESINIAKKSYKSYKSKKKSKNRYEKGALGVRNIVKAVGGPGGPDTQVIRNINRLNTMTKPLQREIIKPLKNETYTIQSQIVNEANKATQSNN